MNSTKPPLKFHNTLVNTISVHLKQHQRHLLDHGALASTLRPNFMIADTQLLINSPNLLNYNDFPIVVICITQYLTSLLCGFPQPGRPFGQPGSRIFSGKLLGAWNSEQPLSLKYRIIGRAIARSLNREQEQIQLPFRPFGYRSPYIARAIARSPEQ